MRIGLVFDDSLDRFDGVQQQVRLFGEWLAGRGHQVHFLVGETNTYQPPANCTLHSLSKNIAIKANQNRLSLPLPVKRSQVTKLLDEIELDLIHVMLPYSPELGRSVVNEALRRGLPVIGTFHTYPASSWQRLGSWLYGRYLRPKLSRFAQVFSVSRATADYVSSTFGTETAIMPNAINMKRFKSAKSRADLKQDKDKLLIFMNRLDERKGAVYLVKALALLPDSLRRDLKVLLCGQGPLRAELERLIVELGLEQIVDMPGFIDEADKPDYLASADLAVYPATGGEAFGIVLIEAMAAGTTTIGGDNAGYRSVLDFNRLALFDPSDSHELAALINKLLTDNKVNQTLQKSQQAAVAAYDIELIGKELEQVYRRTVAERAAV